LQIEGNIKSGLHGVCIILFIHFCGKSATQTVTAKNVDIACFHVFAGPKNGIKMLVITFTSKGHNVKIYFLSNNCNTITCQF
jgi:hypothetical protein